MPKSKASFHAVAVERNPGVYETWDEAKEQVEGFPGKKNKKFVTEAEVLEFVLAYRQDTKPVDQAGRVTDDVDELGQQLESMKFTTEKKEVNGLRQLVAFCAGSAPGNGTEGCTAAYAVYFPLESKLIRSERVTDNPTNIRADCLAALKATLIANELDPNTERDLVIYSSYQGLVFAMADDNGRERWIDKWKDNGWKKSKNKLVAHCDIYEKLFRADKLRTISWRFLNQETHPELTKLYQETHNEAEKLARA